MEGVNMPLIERDRISLRLGQALQAQVPNTKERSEGGQESGCEDCDGAAGIAMAALITGCEG